MHKSALDKVAAFVKGYLCDYVDATLDVLDVGSRDVDEQQYSYKNIFKNPNWNYIGMDIEDGLNVDIVVEQPYDWSEIADQSFDVVVCSQVFEHVEFPWMTMMEIARVLRGGGVAMIVAPSQGDEHRYPYDCWRYYSDGMVAIEKDVACNVIKARTQWRDMYTKGGQRHDSAIVLQEPFLTENEPQSFALKNTLSKFTLHEHALLPDLEDIDVQVTVVNSKLKELKTLDVLSKQDNSIVQKISAATLKFKKVTDHLREILHTFKNPVYACNEA